MSGNVGMPTLADAPTDVLLKVWDELDVLDRVVLRASSRALQNALPTVPPSAIAEARFYRALVVVGQAAPEDLMCAI